jgi:hypothetical protein
MFVETPQDDPIFEQLVVQMFTPLLLILGTGIFLAIFVFVVEIIINKTSRKLTRFYFMVTGFRKRWSQQKFYQP